MSDKKECLKMMRDFPIFESLMCSPDVKKELRGCFDLQNSHKERIPMAFGVNIMVEKALPPNSALFIDHKKRIVGIYKDGELVYSSQRKHKRLRKRGNSA